MQLHDKPLADRARDRWDQILPALGIDGLISLNKRKHQPCPFCTGKDRFRFTDHNGEGRYICNQCGAGSGIDLVMKLKGLDFADAAKEIEAVLGDETFKPIKSKPKEDDGRAAMQALWSQCNLIAPGDFVDRYFASRGLKQDGYPRWLRKAESIRHDDADGKQSWHPAMVAKVLAPDGTPTNLHRTYLTLEGQKAAVLPVRKVMRGAILPGSAIRLFDDPGPVLGIAEGIETALAASELFRIPVWSAINSSILAKWEPPAGTTQVLIFGDTDPKFGGQAEAYALAHRLACKNIKVTVELPPTAGKDWNDVLLEKRKVSA